MRASLLWLGLSFLTLSVIACGKPPGDGDDGAGAREPAPVASGISSGSEEDPPPAGTGEADVMCATISAEAGWGCADEPEARGREGDRCPESDEPMEQIEGLYAFPEAPVPASAMPEGVHVTASGLGTCVVRRGSGAMHPNEANRVTVHYLGWNEADGVFDSSVNRRTPATFPLGGVIAGWTEGVQLMVEGEVRRFFIPEDLAYQGRLGRPGGMLFFDVELVAIEDDE